MRARRKDSGNHRCYIYEEYLKGIGWMVRSFLHRLIQFITNSSNKNLEQRLTPLKTNGWNPQVGEFGRWFMMIFLFKQVKSSASHVSFRDWSSFTDMVGFFSSQTSDSRASHLAKISKHLEGFWIDSWWVSTPEFLIVQLDHLISSFQESFRIHLAKLPEINCLKTAFSTRVSTQWGGENHKKFETT